MNPISEDILKKANLEAIFNTYLYLSDKTSPEENESFQSIVSNLENALLLQVPGLWKDRDIHRLNIIKNASDSSSYLANSKIGGLSVSESGLTACYFKKPDGGISVVFKGTGTGEWIDNGRGLSGIPEENTYITYDKAGNAILSKIIEKNYASDQQVEALNWFNKNATKNDWHLYPITVSGHSKGGNKAQFVSINSNIVNECYSFDGQGFSPEALASLKKEYGNDYEKRRQNIRSFSADNDYVNVLGKRLVPPENIYFLKSRAGIHFIDSIIDKNGKMRPLCEQGRLSEYIQMFSEEIMKMSPKARQYATLGIMNIFQKYFGRGIPVNDDNVTTEQTVAGVIIALGSLLNRIRKL